MNDLYTYVLEAHEFNYKRYKLLQPNIKMLKTQVNEQ